ncbi:hypothetical protein [Clostridium fallax]|uniref:Uncharacterized protein n=1 Tax=Clostridium fallax TaxID=1533 RepID=A0A1M4T654_9CLOT|nr:hypothetical protein [Clostridium fallax]SHE39905.1 hypothetical protein SAMN05443638_10235 [Clostridium fallax]SQB22614.1 Uncharacterised protein [Clostridium fallax]
MSMLLVTIFLIFMFGRIIYVDMYLEDKEEDINLSEFKFMYKEKENIIIYFDKVTGYIYEY